MGEYLYSLINTYFLFDKNNGQIAARGGTQTEENIDHFYYMLRYSK